MEQTDFRDWKSYVGDKYWLAKKDNAGMAFKLKDAHWMNFGWGTERDPIYRGGEDGTSTQQSLVPKQLFF